MANEYARLTLFHGSAPRPNPPTTLIVDASGGGDTTTIKAALALTTSATYAVPYRIFVRNGTYNEIQMDGRDYVTIEGESRDGVIIVSNGLRTDVDPVSGQRYVDMAESAKHGFWIHHQMTLKNLTLRSNNVKYCIHTDSTGAWTFTVDNCVLEHSTGYPHGVGLLAGQHIVWTNCIFRYTGANPALDYGIFLHNWNDQAGSVTAYASGCTFDDCGVAVVTELGSEQSDLFTLSSCTGTGTTGISYLTNDSAWNGGEQGEVNLPYSLSLLISSCSFPLPISYDPVKRPNLMDYVVIQ